MDGGLPDSYRPCALTAENVGQKYGKGPQLQFHIGTARYTNNQQRTVVGP